jgi:hypothetical protein
VDVRVDDTVRVLGNQPRLGREGDIAAGGRDLGATPPLRPVTPAEFTLTSSVVPSERSRTKTSAHRLSSSSSRLSASESNATNRPIAGDRRGEERRRGQRLFQLA